MIGHCGKCSETMCICKRIEKQPRKDVMSKSELNRLCAQNPVEMAERIVELERRVKVLTDAMQNIRRLSGWTNSLFEPETSFQIVADTAEIHQIADSSINATPRQTAEQVERWHVEWMKTLPIAGVIEQSNFGNPQQVHLVAIPQLPETKEPTK